jgi:hypothetical protein
MSGNAKCFKVSGTSVGKPHGMTRAVLRTLARKGGTKNINGIIKKKAMIRSKRLYIKTLNTIKDNRLQEYFRDNIEKLAYLGNLKCFKDTAFDSFYEMAQNLMNSAVFDDIRQTCYKFKEK